jgi:hypothetical protein
VKDFIPIKTRVQVKNYALHLKSRCPADVMPEELPANFIDTTEMADGRVDKIAAV